MIASFVDLEIQLDKKKSACKISWTNLSNMIKKIEDPNAETKIFFVYFDIGKIKKELSDLSNRWDIEKSKMADPQHQLPLQIQRIFTEYDKIDKKMQRIHRIIYDLGIAEKIKCVAKEFAAERTAGEMDSVDSERQRFSNTWRDFVNKIDLFAGMPENWLQGFQGTEGSAQPKSSNFNLDARDCREPHSGLQPQFRFVSTTNSNPRSKSEKGKLFSWDQRDNPSCTIQSGDNKIEIKLVETETPETKKPIYQSLPAYSPNNGTLRDNTPGHKRSSTFSKARALQIDHQERELPTHFQEMQLERVSPRRGGLNPAPALLLQELLPEPRSTSPMPNQNRPIDGGFYSSIGESKWITCGREKDSSEADIRLHSQANGTLPSAKLDPRLVDSETHHPRQMQNSIDGEDEQSLNLAWVIFDPFFEQ